MTDYSVDLDSPLPRYYQVYSSLEERIRSGEFRPGDALSSERQLAADYGVSRLTIVKALDILVDGGLLDRQHGRGNFVTAPSKVAVGWEERRIAFCVPAPSESYIFATLRGAMQTAMRHHFLLEVVQTGDGPQEVEVIQNLRARGVDGLVLFSRSTHKNRDLYAEMVADGYPFVMVDRYCRDAHPDVVVFDDECAGYDLTTTLIRKGHRRVALLVGSETFTTSVQERMAGYRRALEEHGIPYDDRWVGAEMDDLLGIQYEQLGQTYAEVLNWMRASGPTAVVAVNNYLAERANAALAKFQMALMQAVIDASVSGIDCQLNVALASVTHRSLILGVTPLVALAWQSGEMLGERAMELLVERINAGAPVPPRVVRLPMTVTELETESLMRGGDFRGVS